MLFNSVEVFPNYGVNGEKSIANTLKLLDDVEGFNSELELGVHLTISSGRPLTNDPGLNPLKSNGWFKSFKAMPSSATPESVKKELIAQIKVLKRNDRIWKKVTHLTNHHDALWFYPEYTKIYIEVADEFELPIRSPEIYPPIKESSYSLIVATMSKPFSEIYKIISAYRLRNKKVGEFLLSDLNYKTTNYLDSSYYGLWNRLVDTDPYDPDKFYAKRQKNLKEIFERIKERQEGDNSEQIVEALFHIRKGSTNGSKQKIPRRKLKKLGKKAFGKYDLPHYNGIDTRYFDGRSIEYNALAWAHNDGELAEWYKHNNVENGPILSIEN